MNAKTKSTAELFAEQDPFIGGESQDDDETPLDRGDSLEEEIPDDVSEMDSPDADGGGDGDAADDTDTGGDGEGAEEEGAEGDSEGEEETPSGEEGDENSGEEQSESESAESEEADKKEDDRPRREPMIPRPRFDQVNNKFQQAKDRIRELEEQLAQGGQTEKEAENQQEELDFQQELADRQQKVHDLILDGKTREAAVEQGQINQQMMEKASEFGRQQARQEVSQSFQRREYDRTLDRLESDFPFINPDNTEAHDPSLVTRVGSIRDSLVQHEGYPPAEALQEAVETVSARYHPDLLSPREEQLREPPAEPAAERETPRQAPKRDANRRADVERKMKAASRQPQPLGGDSAASAKDTGPNIFDMTEAEFDALSEKELARLRGDNIE